MAYAAVASLSHTIDIFLNYHQHSISPQLKGAITSLRKHTVFLQTFFDEFPDKTDLWEEIISEATYMAERIIELQLSDSLLESTVGSSRSKPEQGKYQLPYGFEEVKRVSKEIESIVGELKGTKTMDGPDDELIEIISRLRQGHEEPLRTIAIYGEEGVGKTTLARNAYNDPLIMEHFDIRAWATVSSEYDRPQLIRNLLRSMKVDFSSNTENKNGLVRTLFDKLKGRRYLIVLDGFSNFERLNLNMFPSENNGSRIILTTRSHVSMKMVDHFHKVGFMGEDNAWNVIRENIFKGDPCPSQLVSAGKMIARSCRWVPNCIEVVSGILAAADQTEAAWEDISENIKFAASDYGNRQSRILSLAYTYLPHHLRPCFLYLGIYHNINVSKLVKIWVAEGFLNESEGKSFEETGEEYVEDLVRRNLVLVTKRKSNGRVKRIESDIRLFYVCLNQGHVDSFIHHINSFDKQAMPMELKSCRRSIYFDRPEGYDFLEGVYGSTIRTLVLRLGMSNHQRGFRLSIENASLLRILDLSNDYNYDLSNAYYFDLPEEVFELFHLRYLAFHSGFSISEAISNLENLQTLIIHPRDSDCIFTNLPEGIWRMPQLRHLRVFRFELPSSLGALEDLQTLSRVVDFTCSREHLKMIPNLKKLALFYTNMSRDYELNNLIYLEKLEALKIEVDCSFVGKHNMRCVLPPKLRSLNLCGLQLPWGDMKIVASLPNLQVLKLRKLACIGKTWEISERGFGKLTYLLIQESNLEHWIMEPSHFPRLKSLVLHHCRHLNNVPYDMGKIPTLECIELDDDSLLHSAKWIREHRRSLGYNPLSVYYKDRFGLREVTSEVGIRK
ncbi:putative late blight resistance protein homolog R1B-17 isoform X1 [Salvia splendens]|uniref:putative late blight resistance protein homolog R1B-17 isoform X1 n=1 Tax=Salvia splendens TaxID=180675 RepID=UPI001C27FFE8|nr:putative late blight resistance protein homolog R1B-17 isoform X1 [Salvia splendens]